MKLWYFPNWIITQIFTLLTRFFFIIITTDNFLMKFWSKLSLRKVRNYLYQKNHWRISVFNWDQKIEIVVSIYVHNLKKKIWSQQERPIGTLRRWWVGGIWSALGESRVEGISQRVLHSSAWMLLYSLLTLIRQSGSGPGPRAKFQIMAGLEEQHRLEHIIPPWLALKWPLNSSLSSCLKLFLETQCTEEQCHFCSSFEFRFYHMIFF